jgi:hypothetical protein
VATACLKGGFYGWTLFQSRVQRGVALSPSGIVLCLGQWGCTRALRILLALLSLLSHDQCHYFGMKRKRDLMKTKRTTVASIAKEMQMPRST